MQLLILPKVLGPDFLCRCGRPALLLPIERFGGGLVIGLRFTHIWLWSFDDEEPHRYDKTEEY